MNNTTNNESFSQKDIEVLLQIGIRMLKKIDIPISDSINPNITLINSHSAYGKCSFSRRNAYQRAHGVNTGYIYSIKISKYTLGSSQKSIMNTILHELLHTCENCMNHGSLWKRYAAIVNNVYNYNIQRCDGDKTSEDRTNLRKGIKVNHKLRCDKCGQVFMRTKSSALVLHPERFHCRCGGHIIKEY